MSLTLKDLVKQWIKSEKMPFRVDQNVVDNPAKAGWFVWYHCWALLEIGDDWLNGTRGWGFNKTMVADPKFTFEKVAKYLYVQKKYQDEWLTKQRLIDPERGKLTDRWFKELEARA